MYDFDDDDDILDESQLVETQNVDGNPNEVKTGWSASGTIFPNDPNQDVHLQVDFDEPGTYTLQFNLEVPPSGGGLFYDPVAVINWKVEGNWSVRTISLSQGTSISGTAQGIRVKIYDQSPVVGAGTQEYLASVQVAPGLRPTNTVGPIYKPGLSVTVPAGNTYSVSVDDDIGAVSFWYATNPTAVTGDITVNVVAASGFNYSIDGVTHQCKWVVMAPFTRRIDFVNNAAGPRDINVLFGVDG